MTKILPLPAPKPRIQVRAELAPVPLAPELSFPQWVDHYAVAVMEADGYAPSALSREPGQHAA